MLISACNLQCRARSFPLSRHLVVNWLTIIFGAVGGSFGAVLVINDVISGEESGGGH